MNIITDRNKIIFNRKTIDRLRKNKLRNSEGKSPSIKILKYAHEIEDFMKFKDQNDERKRKTSQKALKILIENNSLSEPKQQRNDYKKLSININSIENDNKITESITDIFNTEQKNLSVDNKKEDKNEKLNDVINKNEIISHNDKVINGYKKKKSFSENKESIKKHNITNFSCFFDKTKFIYKPKKKKSSIDNIKKYLNPKKKLEIIEPIEENNLEQYLSEYKIKIYYDGKFLQITMPKEENLYNFLIRLKKKLFNYNIEDYELLYKLKPIYNNSDTNLFEKKLDNIFDDNDCPSLLLRKKENTLKQNKNSTSVIINNFPSVTDLSNEILKFFQKETLESDFCLDYKENTCIVSFSLPEKAFSLTSFLNKLKENNPIYKLLKIKLDYKLNAITDVAKSRQKLNQAIKLIISPPKFKLKEEDNNDNNNYAFSLRNTKTKKIINYFKSKTNNSKSKIVSLSPECGESYKYYTKREKDAPKVIVLDYKNKIKKYIEEDFSNKKSRRNKSQLNCYNLKKEYNIKKINDIKKENIKENFKYFNNNIDNYSLYNTPLIKFLKNNIMNKNDNKNDEEDPFIAATKLNIKRKISYAFEDNLFPIKKGKLQLQDIKNKKIYIDYQDRLRKRKNSYNAI